MFISDNLSLKTLQKTIDIIKLKIRRTNSYLDLDDLPTDHLTS